MSYTIGILLDKLAGRFEIPAYLKQLIRKAQKNTHVTTGEWLKETSTADLISAHYSARKILPSPKQEQSQGEDPGDVGLAFVYLVDVLSLAEGMEVSRNVGVATKRYNNLSTLISAELLKRRKFNLEINYGKITLDENTEALKFIDQKEDSEILIHIKNMISKSETEKAEVASEPTKSKIIVGPRVPPEAESKISARRNFKL